MEHDVAEEEADQRTDRCLKAGAECYQGNYAWCLVFALLKCVQRSPVLLHDSTCDVTVLSHPERRNCLSRRMQDFEKAFHRIVSLKIPALNFRCFSAISPLQNAEAFISPTLSQGPRSMTGINTWSVVLVNKSVSTK